MSTYNESFSTPVQTKSNKRLGLRRANSSIKKADTPKDAIHATNKRNATTTTPRLQPQSDAKVNYGNLDDSLKNNGIKNLAHTPETPIMCCSLQRQSVSTNCRPYRLSLSKRVREKMTKKRLEFHIANEIEKEVEERKLNEQENEISKVVSQISEKEACSRVSVPIEASEITITPHEDRVYVPERLGSHRNPTKDQQPSYTRPAATTTTTASIEKDPEEMSRDELLAAIEQSRQEIKARQTHAAKVQELQQAIATWQIGFTTALSDLQQKILPPVNKETLLEQLRIPKEMMKYVND